VLDRHHSALLGIVRQDCVAFLAWAVCAAFDIQLLIAVFLIAFSFPVTLCNFSLLGGRDRHFNKDFASCIFLKSTLRLAVFLVVLLLLVVYSGR
jgi:hypothetical protein